MPKVVIDTNIWVSALITTGNPKKLVDAWLIHGLFTVVYPRWLIDELPLKNFAQGLQINDRKASEPVQIMASG